MKKFSLPHLLVFVAALALGVLLHFVFDWLPSPITALISPVRESLWEHLKILFLPLLLSGLFFSRGGRSPQLTPWLLSLLVVCGLMLAVSYIYHITLGGESMAFDIGLYAALMALGFWLPRLLWPLGEWPGVAWLALLLTALLWVFMVWFTFSPPSHILFADLSQGVRTFLTIPV